MSGRLLSAVVDAGLLEPIGLRLAIRAAKIEQVVPSSDVGDCAVDRSGRCHLVRRRAWRSCPGLR